MGMDLYRLLNSEEIRWVLENMSRNKAPGPDGLPAAFFKAFWPAVGPLVTKAVQDVFRVGVVPNIYESEAFVNIVMYFDNCKQW